MERNGFSLVELAIVFLIIGLLIGGILAAQSMITTAKVNALAMQLGQFDAGVENFKTKYNYLPGDAPSFGGNGNNIINGFPDTDDNRIFMGEIANFWNNYDSTQFPGNYSGSLPGTKAYPSGPNKNVPASKLGKSNSFFVPSTLTTDGTTIDSSNIKNFYVILDSSQLQQLNGNGNYFIAGTDSSNSPVKPADLLALDKKIDDGTGNTGNVLSGSIPNPGWVGEIISTPLATCSDVVTGMYQVQNNSYECTPLIRIGASVSDPQ